MEKLSNNVSKKKFSLLKNIFNKDFVISAIIPVIIFSAFDKYGMTLNGIMLSGIWSVAVVCINFVKEHKFNALAAMSAIFSGIGLIGTIISKDPTFYLVSPIIKDILCAIVFFGSLFLKKTLVEIIVEQSFLKNAPTELKKQLKYKIIWRILTIAWGFLNVSQVVLRIVLLYSVSMTSYYAISTSYDNISGPIMIAFSIMFPSWYLKNNKQ